MLMWYGVSKDYNKPATYEQLKKMDFRKIYNNIITTHNLVNVSNIHAKDLKIVDRDKFTYLLTYSFPCQDLSNAGKRLGCSKGSNTRSGLLWEVERILDECGENLPQILLMENVPDLINNNNIKDFQEWELKLSKLGYSNYVQVLNATDYGIPQSRKRVFMISILGDYNYNFPTPLPLKTTMLDLMEDNVNNKYYLSKEQINSIKDWNAQQKPLEQLEKTMNSGISPTLTTRTGAYASSMILIKEPKCIGGFGNKCNNDTQFHMQNRIYDNTIATTLTTKFQPYYVDNEYAIRRLTPLESFRLMGVKDEDYKKIMENQKEDSLYHLAGDSIVVNVLMAIFKQML